MLRLFFFLFIVWERFISERRMISVGVPKTEVEWAGGMLPVPLHNRVYRPIIIINGKRKVKKENNIKYLVRD